jgi:hypothetical protein
MSTKSRRYKQKTSLRNPCAKVMKFIVSVIRHKIKIDGYIGQNIFRVFYGLT